MNRIAKNAIRVALGSIVGLGIAEGAFHVRDHGAFPHLNTYVADPALAVRLRPGATEKIRFGSEKNPVTSVRINAEGYRGAESGAPNPNEIVVVGDSQVFGLGVEENETFAAVLGQSLGVPVRNLGVPTYGPDEYNAVLEESLAKRPAKIVVWTVNMVNDLFEATRANKTRHAVWDGWAVRAESAPANVTSFPGRQWLYGQSHAFYALRRWMHEDDKNDVGFASEGTWKDIGTAAVTADKDHAAAKTEAADLAASHRQEQNKARENARLEHAVFDSDIRDVAAELKNSHEEDLKEGDPLTPNELFRAAQLNPGDIVSNRGGEGARGEEVTAEQIRRGAVLRNKIEARVRADAERTHDQKMLDAFAKRDQADKKLAELEASPPILPAVRSPLVPAIARAQQICAKAGARLIVVVLPIDVQVSSGEWAKYAPAKPVELMSTRILNTDVVAAAEQAGAEGLDVLPALEKAEPDAFLDADIHMTPKGHRAVADAIAAYLKTPRVARPSGGLPAGRSYPPTEWLPNSEIAVAESDPAGCSTRKIREWLGVFCNQKIGEKAVKGVKVDQGGPDVMAGMVPESATLIAPLLPDKPIHAVFAWSDHTRDLDAHLENGVPIVAFSKKKPARSDIPGPTKDAEPLCKCEKWCAQKPVVPNADCSRTYDDDCERMLQCASGSPFHPPKCEPMSAVAGATSRCRPLCGPDLPACASGTTCTDWQGGRVCM